MQIYFKVNYLHNSQIYFPFRLLSLIHYLIIFSCKKQALWPVIHFLFHNLKALKCLNFKALVWWRRWELNPCPKVLPQDFLRVQLMICNSPLLPSISRLQKVLSRCSLTIPGALARFSCMVDARFSAYRETEADTRC